MVAPGCIGAVQYTQRVEELLISTYAAIPVLEHLESP